MENNVFENCIYHKIRKLYRSINCLYDAELKKITGLNIKYTQFLFLYNLYFEPISYIDGSKRLGLDRTSYARVGNILIKNGYITESKDFIDKRLKKIILTPSGKKIVEECYIAWKIINDRYNLEIVKRLKNLI